MTILSQIPSESQNSISLKPDWIGKIDWSQGCGYHNINKEKSKSRETQTDEVTQTATPSEEPIEPLESKIVDTWGLFIKSPYYDPRLEFIKSIFEENEKKISIYNYNSNHTSHNSNFNNDDSSSDNIRKKKKMPWYITQNDNDLKKLEEMQDVYQSQLVVLDINSLNSYKNTYKTKIDIEIEKLEDIIYSDFDE